MTKQITLEDVYEEIRRANRLQVLTLVRRGVQQKEIAAALGISTAALSIMFPKGVLKKVAAGKGQSVEDE